MNYFGLQAGWECHCGENEPPSNRITDDGDCNVPCVADPENICGGHWRMNIFSLGEKTRELDGT